MRPAGTCSTPKKHWSDGVWRVSNECLPVLRMGGLDLGEVGVGALGIVWHVGERVVQEGLWQAEETFYQCVEAEGAVAAQVATLLGDHQGQSQACHAPADLAVAVGGEVVAAVGVEGAAV